MVHRVILISIFVALDHISADVANYCRSWCNVAAHVYFPTPFLYFKHQIERQWVPFLKFLYDPVWLETMT